GSKWAKLARHAAIELCGSRNNDDESPGTVLLSDIRSLFTDRNTDKLTSAEIVTALTDMEHRPWPEWKGGRPITARGLAKLLKPFGVESKNIRTLAGVPKGYTLEQFDDAFARYLPSQSATPLQANKHSTFDDFESATAPHLVADKTEGKS